MASSKGSKRTQPANRAKPSGAAPAKPGAKPPAKAPAKPKPPAKPKAPSAPPPAKAATPPPPPPAPARPWVIVQLSSTGEREKDLATLARAVQRLLGKQLEVFVPAISQKVRDESQTLFYMEGYVFVRYEEGVNYSRLQDTTYFGSVLTQPGPGRTKTYALLQDRELAPLRSGMDQMKVGGFREGDAVRIIQGNFKNLPAEVSYVHDGGEVVQVHVGMRSKKVLMDFPASYLHKVE